MTRAVLPAGSSASALPASQPNILLEALGALPAGAWAELGDDNEAPRLGDEFARAGWRAIPLGTGDDPTDPLASCSVMPVYWMAVHDSALSRLGAWQAGHSRPLVVSTRAAPPALAGSPQAAWQAALARNGYLFVADDDDYAYFVRNDQPALHATLAQLASKHWRNRLRASRQAHAHEARAAGQARKAVLQAQAQASAAQFEMQVLQHQLAAVYASTSWQSTAPLRWSMRLRRQPRSALREVAVLAVRLLRKILRPVLSHALGNPGVHRHLGSLERRHPALVGRIRRLLRPVPPAAPSHAPAPMAPPAIHPDNTVGPQFKTLLLDELDRGLPPTFP